MRGRKKGAGETAGLEKQALEKQALEKQALEKQALEDQMVGSAARRWLGPAVFFSAVRGSALVGPGSAPARAQDDDSSSSISALPTLTGPDESTHAADYVRKPTDPPA